MICYNGISSGRITIFERTGGLHPTPIHPSIHRTKQLLQNQMDPKGVKV